MASQTLLSRMMRTRQGESFFFGQADFSRQTIKDGKQPVQFTFGGKKIFINFFRLLVGKLLYFVNHFTGLHIGNITVKPHGSILFQTGKPPLILRDTRQV